MISPDELKIGDLIKVRVPHPLPDWISDADPLWKLNLERFHQIISSIKSLPRISYDYQKWMVEIAYPFNAPFMGNNIMIFLEWLELPTIYCDCPLSLILTRGCSNKGHI